MITVVMPAYNAELTIGKAIESVLNQSITNFELIIINDGSTDRTECVVKNYNDPRVKIINQDNKGCYQARNVGIREAKGKYIGLLDSDDWFAPLHLEMTSKFLEHNSECSLVGTNYFIVNHKGEITLGCKPKEILGKHGNGIIFDYFKVRMRNRIFPITNCVLFRKEVVEEFGPFDESLRIGGDNEFWLRWAMKSRFGYIDEPLSYYQIDTPGSVRKDLIMSIRMRTRVWRKLTALERVDIQNWKSYSKCRSYSLFRLTALALATGSFEEAKDISAYWPYSPNHLYWWCGMILASLPRFIHKAIFAITGRLDFVKYRQGKPTNLNAN